MCGIAGIVDLAQQQSTPDDIQSICSGLRHRGPDDEGYYIDSPVALGQTRLSIIDLVSGKQPLSNEDETVWITFNGEIYNFQSLRQRLESLGHRFTTHSDTEVIVHAYEEYGVHCLKHFRGMFAFAIWDRPRRTLFLARDRVGKKPLYYHLSKKLFVFASEVQALLRYPFINRQVNSEAIDKYLTYGYVPGPSTAFSGVCKLPPAHYLLCQIDESGQVFDDFRVERYWQLKFAPKQDLSDNEAMERLLAVLTEAVRLRLISDVPLGALLSGGVDSSLVVALMSRIGGQTVKTFSIGFEEQQFNELPYARRVAELYGTDHHEMIVRPNALEILPKLIRHYGEPFADSSAIPSYYVAKLTSQHVKVVLNGDGGDESFAGYDRYLGSLFADRFHALPALIRCSLTFLSRLIPNSLSRRNRLQQAKRLLTSSSLPVPKRYLRWIGYFDPSDKQSLYTPDFLHSLGSHDAQTWLVDVFEQARNAGADSLDQLLTVDVNSYLPYDLLVKMDIATMACSLEARSPLLDQEVMEFAATLPSSLKIRKGKLKYLLKRVASTFVPQSNLYRRKMGFGVPVGFWMRRELRPLVEDMLLNRQAKISTYIKLTSIQRLVEDHLRGKKDNSYQVWSLLWLELWFREFRV